MDLMQLLEIDRDQVRPEDEQGLEYARLLFRQAGGPTDKRRVHDALEHIIVVCRREGVRYPPILLLRLKNLERGLWTPRRKAPATKIASCPPPSSSAQSCTLCHGTGTRTVDDGKSYKGVPCECKRNSLGGDA